MEVKRRSLVIVTLVFVSTFSAILTTIPETVKATTLFVGGTGLGNYTRIQDAINASNPGDTVYVYNGTYNEFLTVNKPLSIIGEDTNKTVIVINRGIDLVYISADWVNISGFTIMNTNYLTDGGIFLDHVQNCTITNNRVSINSHGIALHYSNNNTIIQNEISNNYRAGIHLQYSVNNTISSNKMVNNGIVLVGQSPMYWSTHTIDISNTVNGKPVYYWKNVAGGTVPPAAGQVILFNCTGVIIENQNLSNASGGIQLAASPHTTILNNNVSNDRLIGISLRLSHNSTIVDSTIYGNGLGIHLDHSSNTAVENNTIKGGSYGIYLDGTSGSRLANNSVSLCGSGIYLLQSHNNTLANNTALQNSAYGIDAVFSSNNTYVNSTVWGNLLEGLRLAASDNSTITGGTAFSNTWGGISLWGSNNNSIHNVNVSDNYYGFSLWNSEGNMLVNNTAFSNRDSGMVLGGSSNNSVYHNSFIDNPIQASDGDANRWDNGYPSGGNYWSDYVGVDEFYGPNQDQPGWDGIGDTKYDIPGGFNMDRYPLMSPFEMIHPLPPTKLRAILTGENLENVTLNWTLSLDDGNVFKSVTGYRIYRNTSYTQGGSGYVNIATLSNGTSEFDDNLAGEGNPDNYFYLVCAVDLNNKTNCARNQVSKFTRSLSKGSNLMSVPLIQYDDNLSTVLQTLYYDDTWTYNPRNQEWKSFMELKPYGGSFEYVNRTMGLWVDVTQDSNITVAGVVPISTTINLQAGWNLVGFPCLNTTYTVGDLKSETGATRVEGFNIFTPPYHLENLQDTDSLLAGYGYWIYVEFPAIWILGNS